MVRLTLGIAALSLIVACGDDATTGGSGGVGGGGDDEGGAPTTNTGGGPTGGASTGGAGGEGTGGTGTGGMGGEGTGGSPPTCLMDWSAGHHEVTCDGIAYDVEIPGACTNASCGLIVDIHGYTMNGDSEDENTGMRALGQANGYVVVQPTAPVDQFNFPSWDQPTHAPLVFGFLEEVASALPIDPTKIHTMGFSQGGGMTFRLLCDHADFFASGAPIGALAGCAFSGAETPSEEVDILHVHGRVDGVVSFPNTAIPQRDAALAAWDFGAPAPIEQDAKHLAQRWTTSAGTVFEFWEHDYETDVTVVFVELRGHCVPGGEDFDGVPGGYSCQDTGTFVFGELAMQFFIAHPKN